MGSQSPKPDYGMMAYQSAYNAAKQGQPRQLVLEDGWKSPSDKNKYYEFAQAGFNAGMPFVMPEFEMPEFHMPEMPDFGAQMAQIRQQGETSAANAQAAQEQARAAQEQALKDQYMNQARTNVADRLKADLSRTRTLGMEYKPPEVGSKEYKKLVDDEFTKLYGTGSQSLIGGNTTKTNVNATGRKSLITGVNTALEDEDELSKKALLGG